MTKREAKRARRYARRLFGDGAVCARDHLGRRVIVSSARVMGLYWHPDRPGLDSGGGTWGTDYFNVRGYEKATPAPIKRGRRFAKALTSIEVRSSANDYRMRDSTLEKPWSGVDVGAWLRLARMIDRAGGNVAPFAHIHSPHPDLPRNGERTLAEQLRTLGIVNSSF